MSLSDALPTAMLGAASAIAPMLQARQQHGKELEVTHELHRTAISQAERFHEKELDTTKALHSEAVNHARNLQYEALGHSEKLHKHGVKHSEKLHREGLGLNTRLHLEALQQELAHRTSIYMGILEAYFHFYILTHLLPLTHSLSLSLSFSVKICNKWLTIRRPPAGRIFEMCGHNVTAKQKH
eukprot:TRINITY_DN1174_c1_g1_i3.p1 TRINITY_DN1174_c1_g1~~TRINITY_DN1174_c1_g1_i3.p1  ORF type:complete len:183 (+),score=20.25 TRINITY_DN1174_c1_g1_i3:34-582(+)